MRHRIALQSPTYTSDDAGVVTPTYATAVTVWGYVEPLSDSMISQAAQAIGALSHRVTIRYYPGIKAGWRILWGTRVLDVTGPPRNIDERNWYIELRCVEQEVV